MNTPILILIIVSIVTFAALIAWRLYLDHKAEVSSPQHTCLHEMVTKKTRGGTYSQEYLSTCKKCGKQSTHFFSGLNSQ